MTKYRNILFLAALILIITSCKNPYQTTNHNNFEYVDFQEKLPQDFDTHLAFFGKTTDTTGNVIDLQDHDIYLGKYKLQVTFESNQSTMAKGVFSKGTYNLFNTEKNWNKKQPITYNLENLTVNNENGKIGTKTIAAIACKIDGENYTKATTDVIIEYITETSPENTITDDSGSTTITFIIDIQVKEK